MSSLVNQQGIGGPAGAPAVGPAAGPGCDYTVQPGDTLSAISQRHRGGASNWGSLYDQNQGVVGNDPNLILPGQVLDVCEPAAHVPGSGVGLDAYQVVPDDFVGPLGPNQIQQSQRDTLDQYDFSGFNVVGDDHVGPLSAGQMVQGDYDAMQSAWLNIAAGQGMNMTGSAGDQEDFMQMMRESMGESSVLREQITTIGNDADPAHAIDFDLGRGQDITGHAGMGVWGDTFATGQVDLDDFDFFPATPGAAQTDEVTRTELLAHFISERQSAVTSANPNNFGPHHSHGMGVQNQVRDEFGQQHITGQFLINNAAGGSDLEFNRADGTTQTTHTDGHNNPTGNTF